MSMYTVYCILYTHVLFSLPTTLIPRTAADVASSGRVGGKMHLFRAGQDQRGVEMTSEKPTDEFQEPREPQL